MPVVGGVLAIRLLAVLVLVLSGAAAPTPAADLVAAGDIANTDPTGPTEFVVGTGGASLTGVGATAPNSVTRAGNIYGVLRVTLNSRSYAWQFLPAAGFSYSDSGTASCVGLAPTRWGCDSVPSWPA